MKVVHCLHKNNFESVNGRKFQSEIKKKIQGKSLDSSSTGEHSVFYGTHAQELARK